MDARRRASGLPAVSMHRRYYKPPKDGPFGEFNRAILKKVLDWLGETAGIAKVPEQLWSWFHISLWDPLHAGLRPREILLDPASQFTLKTGDNPAMLPLSQLSMEATAGLVVGSGFFVAVSLWNRRTGARPSWKLLCFLCVSTAMALDGRKRRVRLATDKYR